jgi:IS30 family transposase
VGKKWVSGDCSYLCKGLISEKLKEYWSPEQIMGRLELDKKIKISTETLDFTNHPYLCKGLY